MINVIICVSSPGVSTPGFGCPFNEHWACSTDCWRKVAHACIEEHMLLTLKKYQGEKRAN
jgi:hypothetical protein